MNIEINLDNHLEIDKTTIKKMIFLYNALDNGWSIKKINDSYIFTKNHEGRKEIFNDNYLTSFIKENLNINNILK
jgi:hypothetical protein